MEQTEGSVWSKHKNWYREALPAGFEYGPTLSCWWPCGGGWEHEKAGWQCGERTYTPQHQKEKHASRERERARANTYARKAALRPLTVWVVVSGERADALSRAVQLAIHEGFARSTSGACVRARGEKVLVEMFFETIWISFTFHKTNEKVVELLEKDMWTDFDNFIHCFLASSAMHLHKILMYLLLDEDAWCIKIKQT